LAIKLTAKTRDKERRRFLVLLNRYREQKGMSPLSMDTALQRAAQWMSDDMGYILRRAKKSINRHPC
jgi:uncharacterized protein YkwD